MDIYIHQNGEQSSPYSEAEVQELFKSGRLQSTDHAWHKSAAEWEPIIPIRRMLGRIIATRVSGKTGL